MSIEVELRYPTVAYGYANVKVTADSPTALEQQLAAYQKQIGLAINLAGGGDSHAQAVRLIKEELGGVVIEEEATPWSQPSAPVNQPWGETSQPTSDPFASGGGDPFGGAQSGAAADPFSGAPARDFFYIEVPRDKMDAWKEDRAKLQATQGKGAIGWDGDAKRNTIKKSVAQNVLDAIKARGYDLR